MNTQDQASPDTSSPKIPPTTPNTPQTVFQTINSPQHPPTPYRNPAVAHAVLHHPIQTPFYRTNLTLSHLPYPIPFSLTAGPENIPPDFSRLSESCGGRAAMGVFGGGVMGLVMGVFLGAMSDMTPPVTVINGKEVPQAPLKEQMRTTMRATADKSLYWCRNFAFITGVFSGSECLVEKFRGKTDVWNPVVSGCVTGAMMQAKSGVQGAAFGCAGFAAFSIVIDVVMGH
mmetsp:Transcript_20687/g.25602  ORF Transcript_20687/g.25602 Transcript_20687/m.25602 type:complete len:229 (-) Transcript_20687:126-812(-)|eukprot:CAMPEP_0172517996 /NCGR_PEP_ID=MMETSP1066-20121228/289595_1 /TAXON_ID=671091 /ORGANISM="Coscinodiscus wailesii, Strain CCMP2513" /LENGTH=228 /DNA_ID=CAMNT_0013300259 /DNA_START=32 /DNA_END=718 /DNA_ORIENTATION=-